MNDMIMLEIQEKMDKAIENLEKKFTTVRTGRANPSSLDGIMVDYESQKRKEPKSYIYFDEYKIIYEEGCQWLVIYFVLQYAKEVLENGRWY